MRIQYRVASSPDITGNGYRLSDRLSTKLDACPVFSGIYLSGGIIFYIIPNYLDIKKYLNFNYVPEYFINLSLTIVTQNVLPASLVNSAFLLF